MESMSNQEIESGQQETLHDKLLGVYSETLGGAHPTPDLVAQYYVLRQDFQAHPALELSANEQITSPEKYTDVERFQLSELENTLAPQHVKLHPLTKLALERISHAELPDKFMGSKWYKEFYNRLPITQKGRAKDAFLSYASDRLNLDAAMRRAENAVAAAGLSTTDPGYRLALANSLSNGRSVREPSVSTAEQPVATETPAVEEKTAKPVSAPVPEPATPEPRPAESTDSPASQQPAESAPQPEKRTLRTRVAAVGAVAIAALAGKRTKLAHSYATSNNKIIRALRSTESLERPTDEADQLSRNSRANKLIRRLTAIAIIGSLAYGGVHLIGDSLDTAHKSNDLSAARDTGHTKTPTTSTVLPPITGTSSPDTQQPKTHNQSSKLAEQSKRTKDIKQQIRTANYTGQYPWNIVDDLNRKFNFGSQNPMTELDTAAKQSGLPYEWHGNGRHRYIKVAGHTDTKQVMEALATSLAQKSSKS